jgi:hypothetical protein
VRWVGLWTDQLSLQLSTSFPFNLSTFQEYVSTGNSANVGKAYQK